MPNFHLHDVSYRFIHSWKYQAADIPITQDYIIYPSFFKLISAQTLAIFRLKTLHVFILSMQIHIIQLKVNNTPTVHLHRCFHILHLIRGLLSTVWVHTDSAWFTFASHHVCVGAHFKAGQPSHLSLLLVHVVWWLCIIHRIATWAEG